jgi:hypothetical protein
MRGAPPRVTREAMACPSRVLVLVTLAACGSGAASVPPPEAREAAAGELARAWGPGAPGGAGAPPPTADGRRWIPGDLHLHVAPLDAREGVTWSPAEIAPVARREGLEFVILTPHLWSGTWRDPARRARWQRSWEAMAQAARARDEVTLIPGVEYGIRGVGHFGVSGVEPRDLAGGDFLAAASAAGAFVVVNHPFAVPTKIPGIPASERDLSFRPWSHGSGRAPAALGGVEVWNVPLGLANLLSRPGGQTGEARAFAAADALARAERRPVTVVGGTDSHRPFVQPTTWVLARDAREPTVLAALRAGATCVGGPEAGTLEARGDADPPDRWARVGEGVRAAARVELRWLGRGRLFVDGIDRGLHDGAYRHTGVTGVHTYRIEVGDSRCGFVYANLE